jgi:hypothetical protein
MICRLRHVQNLTGLACKMTVRDLVTYLDGADYTSRRWQYLRIPIAGQSLAGRWTGRRSLSASTNCA